MTRGGKGMNTKFSYKGHDVEITNSLADGLPISEIWIDGAWKMTLWSPTEEAKQLIDNAEVKV